MLHHLAPRLRPSLVLGRPLVSAALTAVLAAVLAVCAGDALALPSAPGAAAAGSRAPEARPYWVFFKDRGGMDVSPAALARAAEAIPAEVWARRARGTGAALPDVRDLPVWEPYVEEITSLGPVRHRSQWLNAASFELTPKALKTVEILDFVSGVRPVAVGKDQGLGPLTAPDGTPLETTLPLPREPLPGPYPYGPSYGQLQEIGVPAVHAAGYTGNRVLFMMLDTGFRKNHHAFTSAHIAAEWDFVFEDGQTQDEPEDSPGQQSHGTGTWAVSGGYDPGHIVGPAYGASFVLAKTEDVPTETEAEEDNYVAALEWADQLGVTVTSASLSYTCFDDGFCYDFPLMDGDTPVISRAVDIAAARGILCVNSAGNYGYLGPMSLGTPADADSIVSVGAVDSLNVLAEFSSRGPTDDGRMKPEVAARGVSTWWADANGIDTYGPASGTSLSCPLVGGAAALLVEAHPEWGPMQIRSALMNTADRHTHPDNDYGWGRVNLPAALAWTPVIFPKPFSLVAPANEAHLSTVAPTFRWRASRDLDQITPLHYEVHLRDSAPGGGDWLISSGSDTTLTLSFALLPIHHYDWDVTAEDAQGHRRLSRETFGFFTPTAASAPANGPVEAAQPWTLSVGPNPSSGTISFSIDSAAAESGGSHVPFSWSVYDPLGRRVAGLTAGAGVTQGSWDGRNPEGAPSPAGVYFLEVRLGDEIARKTLVRMSGRS